MSNKYYIEKQTKGDKITFHPQIKNNLQDGCWPFTPATFSTLEDAITELKRGKKQLEDRYISSEVVYELPEGD